MAAEIIAEQFSPETMQMMTEVKLPTPEMKQQAMMAAQQMQQQQQPIPKKLQQALDDPTWDECLQILRDDQQRCYRIDIETDSTIAGDQAADQKAMTELLTGVATFIQNAGPAVEAGYLPLDAAKSMLMTAVRKFKMGREVEDALDMIGEDEGEEQQPDPQMLAMQEQMQELQETAQQLQQENETVKQENAALKADNSMAHEKAMEELDIKSRELGLKETEAFDKSQEPPVDEVALAFAENEKERDKMEFEREQNALDRQTDLAKAIISKSDSGEDGESVDDIVNRLNMDMNANKTVIYDDMGNITGVETVGIEDNIGKIRDALSQQSEADRGGMENALVQMAQMIADSNERLTSAIVAPKRAIYENGRPVGMVTEQE
jgi:hypothetical protein